MRALIENDKNVMCSFMTTLSTKIVYLNKKINSLTAGSAERKLSVFLADNAVSGVYEQKNSASAIAEMLDIGRASLYRAFDRLREDGFLQKDGRNLCLLDPDAMLDAYK